jgi:hypothetical protein
MGVVSFGVEKVCFGLGGGALVAHSAGVLDAARQIALGYPGAGSTLARLASTVVLRRGGWFCLYSLCFRVVMNETPMRRRSYRQKIWQTCRRGGVQSDGFVGRKSASAGRGRRLASCWANAMVWVDLPSPGSACLTQVIVSPRRTGDRATRSSQPSVMRGSE